MFADALLGHRLLLMISGPRNLSKTPYINISLPNASDFPGLPGYSGSVMSLGQVSRSLISARPVGIVPGQSGASLSAIEVVAVRLNSGILGQVELHQSQPVDAAQALEPNPDPFRIGASNVICSGQRVSAAAVNSWTAF
ncbi:MULTISPECIES: hypothetical protein [Pseudomonas]|uniref:hypothetical protein n=1 Tax=Pseudomonas TaxID=286 RepID=UPI00257E4F8A|nr:MULTISPECIES: hypothetical protein [Pseudomonas]